MSKKRSHSEGTIRPKDGGRWEDTLMIGYQSDGRRKYKTFYGRTQAEVKLLLEKLPEDQIGWGIRLMLCTGMRTQTHCGRWFLHHHRASSGHGKRHGRDWHAQVPGQLSHGADSEKCTVLCASAPGGSHQVLLGEGQA